jgi:hypothetical protein
VEEMLESAIIWVSRDKSALIRPVLDVVKEGVSSKKMSLLTINLGIGITYGTSIT